MLNNKPRTLLASAAVVGFAAIGLIGAHASLAAQSPLHPLGRGPVTNYQAQLDPLNNSGARGMAMLQLSSDQRTLTVRIRAWGLERGGVHVSHIHGLSANGRPVNSTCPTRAQDADHDGFVELAEGQTTYGPILVDFMNVDPDEDGQVNFTKTITLTGSEGVLPLTDRHIVIHGKTVGAVGAGTPGEVNGTPGYKTVLPVLCGEIRQVYGGVRFPGQ